MKTGAWQGAHQAYWMLMRSVTRAERAGGDGPHQPRGCDDQDGDELSDGNNAETKRPTGKSLCQDQPFSRCLVVLSSSAAKNNACQRGEAASRRGPEGCEAEHRNRLSSSASDTLSNSPCLAHTCLDCLDCLFASAPLYCSVFPNTASHPTLLFSSVPSAPTAFVYAHPVRSTLTTPSLCLASPPHKHHTTSEDAYSTVGHPEVQNRRPSPAGPRHLHCVMSYHLCHD